MKKTIAMLLTAALGASLLTGCISIAPTETSLQTESGTAASSEETSQAEAEASQSSSENSLRSMAP